MARVKRFNDETGVYFRERLRRMIEAETETETGAEPDDP
jgi:hypothetical protein